MITTSNKFAILQKIGKAFMLPIALLPAAGLLLGIGGAFTNETMIQAYSLENTLGQGTLLNIILSVMRDTGGVVFENLPLIFSLGIAIGLANVEKGSAGLAGGIGFLIMHKAINSTLTIQGITTETVNSAYLMTTGLNEAQAVAKSFEYTNVLGMHTLQIGVLGGMISGFIAAYLHNKYYDIKLPQFLAFFGGTRFVPIVTTGTMLIIGIMLVFIWPPIQSVIAMTGKIVEQSGYFGSFLFGIIERALVPTGLHHIFYMPFWQTPLGGTMEINGELVSGAQKIFFAQLADPNFSGHFEVTKGTRFWVGKWPGHAFGLPGAALAMWWVAKPERKKEMAAFLGSVAFTSFLTGITEPIEFTFLFAAPILFFGFNVFMYGMGFVLMHLLNVGVGVTFADGFIDYLLYGILQGNERTSWINILYVGIPYFFIYFFVFKWTIVRFDFKTPGREDDGVTATRASSKEILDNLREVTTKTIKGLGGIANIKYNSACITKLRIEVYDINLVKDNAYFKSIGAKGIIRQDKGLQIIFGVVSDNVNTEIEKIMKELQTSQQ
ncbi:PTS transporter subunit EIIC [Borrelia venezuelensis]|uniref:PTS transporter subunit EIIC n=1 Tax=Borrelia venezuelensis TaxID=1653839 RepID=UPI001FF54674|nr:PTS transporter subunit EIIC [Borrelia venezuelensis]UPA12839.1 PTS transporter subunit EIIC [Borrelia venezuelensis]UPA12869.1 PTS transporter subunit EIIC [Borrelia venezuelensis]